MRSSFLLVLLISLFSALNAAEENQALEHRLPAADVAVIILNYTGGMVRPQNDDPTLAIFADGRVAVGNAMTGEKPLEMQLGVERVQELLRYVIDEQDFFHLSVKELRADVQQARGQGGLRNMMAVADAATTVIRVQADDKDLETSYYALSMNVGQLPKAEKLAKLRNIELRLSQLRAEVIVGGAEKVALHLKFANEQLTAKYPQAKELSVADLRSAFMRQQELHMTFYHQEQVGDSTSTVSVQVKVPTEGAATARVYVKDIENKKH